MTRKRTPSTSPPPVILGEFSSVTPSLNDGDEIALQFDASGNLLCNVVAGGGSGSNAAAGLTGSAVPLDADYQGINIGGNLTGQTGLAVGSAKAATVAIVDGSGNQVTAFGGSASAVASNFHLVSAGSTNANGIKGGAGTLFGVHVFNNAAYPVYVKIYNKASAPTVGTDTPFKTVGVQAGTQRDYAVTGGGITMGTGIALAITKGIADADSTAVLASDCVVEVEYT